MVCIDRQIFTCQDAPRPDLAQIFLMYAAMSRLTLPSAR
jgi:hypothetical protein